MQKNICWIKVLTLVFGILVSVVVVAKPTWFRFKKNGLTGFKNSTGKVIIPAKYKHAENPVGNIAAVIENGNWVWINKRGGKLVVPFIYDNGPDYFVEGLSRFVSNNKVGFINKHGQIVIKAHFDFVTPFEKGYAIYCIGCKSVRDGDSDYHVMKGGRWGCIDKNGRIVPSSCCEPRFKRWTRTAFSD